MRYSLLLRGINVGGKNKVNMNQLKSILKESEFSNIDSYINSGNIFFDSELSYSEILVIIKDILKINYSFQINFSLLSQNEFNEDYINLPSWWNEDLARKDVLFFNVDLDKNIAIDFIENLELNNEIVDFGQHAIFWGKYDESEYLKTSYHKHLLKSPFYKEITIRNGKTYEKIHEKVISN